jgi:hypothetical protein
MAEKPDFIRLNYFKSCLDNIRRGLLLMSLRTMWCQQLLSVFVSDDGLRCHMIVSEGGAH